MYQDIKRVIDIVFAIFLAVLFLPVWIITPLLIYFESGTPIFYRHRRIGMNGKEFWLYKFRTMVTNADKILLHNKRLLAEFKNGDWKLKNDPRITKLGRILRNLTIDEFPQLFNVLRGEMSLVGPRAYVKQEIKEQTKKYPQTKKWIRSIMLVKPGVTGVWQTSGRNEIPFVKRAKMDYDYSKGLSFWGDLNIILKTPEAMVSKW
ncbi:galactosyl-1-phosphate transferase [Candidatus Beckwithbacteria bacterium CG10_big_fil_rev_8_21_14_0_10_34_10]|uniref:Galactosyl-1-phosphate transferase n=1 Tax=Candidatus Beckwithbacteria bacterium CG10_big_fil_rev_8_21_14_0_10_34_10 TaxID=1974495 RepID=A0A2H0W911_9BACT|nr:MAG: galactosyl-1-phosphate transferase [Candidatus Beckwithbacteria bacterium CG10_big_fil_rev_8_21_14_0_10_34_10]